MIGRGRSLVQKVWWRVIRQQGWNGTSKLVHMNQNRVCTLCFPDADAGTGTCCYSCRPGAIYKGNEHSKHKRVCGSDGRSSWLRPKPNNHNKDKQAQVLSGSWGRLSNQVHCPLLPFSSCQTIEHLISLTLTLTTPYEAGWMYSIYQRGNWGSEKK